MKKIFLIIVFITALTEIKACDICGCGVGSSYIGILPDFRKRIFGIRYRYNSLLTHVGVGGTTSYLTTNESYKTMELWGGWTIGNFRIIASVPYSFDERTNQGVSQSKNGIGDISLTAFYQLLNKRKTVWKDKLLVQSLWIGGGIKLPTGEYNPLDQDSSSQNTNLFQLGTASTDLTVNAMYDIRLQDVGLNVSSSYKMNTANKYEYNYGNKFTTSVQAYYKFKIKDVSLAPNAGVLYEKAEKDIDHDILVDISGGNVLAGSIGVESMFKRIAVGANWQTPLSQDLANGIVKAQNRLMVHVSVAL